jgi:protein-histidine N-methyltransferase
LYVLDLSSDEDESGLTSIFLFRRQLETLPPLLSYTPVTVPLSTGTSRNATFLRRDLFDARFQVLNQDDDEEEGEEEEGAVKDKGKEKEELYIDEQTDLVKGVYEGGLKTWECSLDLVDLLDSRGYAADEEVKTERVRGKSVLEVRLASPSYPFLC